MNARQKIQCVPLKAAFMIITGICLGAESPDIGNFKVFPEDNPWNWDISDYEVDPLSDQYIESIGRDSHLHPDFGTVWEGAPIGIPYCVVGGDQPLVPVHYTAYGDESDPGPFRIPLDAEIEGGPDSDGDRHVIAIDPDHAMLYELYRAFPMADVWNADSGAKYDMTGNALRPEGWTSADAAGLPIFPGLVRYEEVMIDREIDHAVRFTVEETQRKYIYPARHYASHQADPNLPPMGLRLRLKSGYDISGFSEPVQVILSGLKKYGMILADNGSSVFISGAPDDRWDDEVLGELKSVNASEFEAVRTVDDEGNPIFPLPTGVEGPTPCRLQFGVYPNPFNAVATLQLDLPRESHVTVKCYDLRGREVLSAASGLYPAGCHHLLLDGNRLPSGMYIIGVKAGAFRAFSKINLLK